MNICYHQFLMEYSRYHQFLTEHFCYHQFLTLATVRFDRILTLDPHLLPESVLIKPQ